MVFDPNKPAPNADILSQELRDQFNSLKALIDAQQTQISAQTALIADQQIQIAGLQAHFPLSVPEISSDLSSSADGSIAKSAVPAAPEAWQFVVTVSSGIDPNQDLSNCTLLAVLPGSADGGDTWTKHGGSGGIAPLMAVRYRVGGQWSPFSAWVMSET